MTASANPRCQLAPRTPAQQCAPTSRNSFKTNFTAIPERLDPRQLMQLLTARYHHRRRWQSQKRSINHQTAFNLHNPLQHQRDRSACGFLLTS
jgi:hypothetical protein